MRNYPMSNPLRLNGYCLNTGITSLSTPNTPHFANSSLLIPHFLALHSTGGDAFDDVLLGEHVDDDDGDDAEHDDCHGGAQVNGAVASLQILDVDGDGHSAPGIRCQRHNQF